MQIAHFNLQLYKNVKVVSKYLGQQTKIYDIDLVSIALCFCDSKVLKVVS